MRLGFRFILEIWDLDRIGTQNWNLGLGNLGSSLGVGIGLEFGIDTGIRFGDLNFGPGLRIGD